MLVYYLTDGDIFPFPSYFPCDFLCSFYCFVQGAFGFDDFVFAKEKKWHDRIKKKEGCMEMGRHKILVLTLQFLFLGKQWSERNGRNYNGDAERSLEWEGE
jgi:hypothetical protein